jgi:hypothetical protein|nr:MAG TPA: terminase small subunit [Caudoviricetes sp.]
MGKTVEKREKTQGNDEKTAKKVPSLERYVRKIKSAMQKCGTYDANLEFQILNLARSLRLLALVDAEMGQPDFELVVMKLTRDGEQPMENPLLKTLDRAQTQVNRQMTQLKLTVEDLIGAPELPDGVDELTSVLDKIN